MTLQIMTAGRALTGTSVRRIIGRCALATIGISIAAYPSRRSAPIRRLVIPTQFLSHRTPRPSVAGQFRLAGLTRMSRCIPTQSASL
jgi:hypothetical protein